MNVLISATTKKAAYLNINVYYCIAPKKLKGFNHLKPYVYCMQWITPRALYTPIFFSEK